jgi:hypothetical protein
MWLGPEKPQADNHILSPMPEVVFTLSRMEIGKPVQPVIVYPCRQCPWQGRKGHVDIRFGLRHGHGFCIAGRLNSEIVIFDNVFRVKAICTYFVTCQPFLDFSDQIVRQDYSSLGVQGSHGPCECSRLHFMLIDEQRTEYGVSCYG